MTDTALILGDGPCARQVAEDLLKRGIDVILASAGASFAAEQAPLDEAGSARLTRLQHAELSSLQGTVGNFSATMTVNGHALRHEIGALIIAESDVLAPTASLYGLHLSQGVLPLSRLGQGAASRDDLKEVKTAVLISGVGAESRPAVTRRVMETALRLQSVDGIQTYLMTGNLKVAGDGLEALYRQAKAAGVVFFKFDAALPRFQQGVDGRVRIEFDDPVMRMPCRLTPDLCVVDETVTPSERLARLAAVLDLPVGPDGFIQTDNVHRQTVFTIRKGVLAVGPSRCAQSQDDHRVDARNAALAVYGLMTSAGEDDGPKAAIDTGRCIRCLTCYRLCPYRAVTVAARVVVAADACAGCGICAAECPRRAIHIEGLRREDVEARIADATTPEAWPRMVALCCSRSAAQAARSAACSGYRLPAGLTVVEVPCAGGVSLEHLLAVLANGADGALVLTCHADNCHSERGNHLSHDRVDHLGDVLAAVGFDRRRLMKATLAANMGREFSDITSNFESVLAALEPQPQAVKERKHAI